LWIEGKGGLASEVADLVDINQAICFSEDGDEVVRAVLAHEAFDLEFGLLAGDFEPRVAEVFLKGGWFYFSGIVLHGDSASFGISREFRDAGKFAEGLFCLGGGGFVFQASYGEGNGRDFRLRGRSVFGTRDTGDEEESEKRDEDFHF